MMARLIAVIFAGLWILLLLLAVRRRWLARLRYGFVLTLMLALVGTGVSAVWLAGVWGYEAARKALEDQTDTFLESVEHVAAAEVSGAISLAAAHMNDIASALAEDRGRIESDTERRIHGILEMDRQILQINLHDARGAFLKGFSLLGRLEPPNRIAAAFGLEGRDFVSDPYHSPVFDRHVLNISVPVRSENGGVLGVLGGRFDIQAVMLDLIKKTRFGETGYVVLINPEGRILAHPDPARLNDDLSGYLAVRNGLRGQQGRVVHANKAGEERLFFYHPIRSPATVNPGFLVLLTEMSAEEAEKPIRVLRYYFLLLTAALGLVCVLMAHQLSRSLKKPIQELLHVVGRVRQGDLTARVQGAGQDEIGQLGEALNQMVRGLEERDRVKELFGRYVTTQVSEEVLKGRVNLGGETRRLTILFSDIRNFTGMSEQMAPASVVEFLNEYFSEMVEAVFEYGGVLDKFIGDGMMAVFGSFGDMPDHPRRAVMAALRMKARLAKINGERAVAGRPPVQIGIGIHTDEVIVGNIGSRKRLEFTVIGDGVNTTSRVEGLNKDFGTTTLITETTYEEVKDLFECREMPEARLKGKTRVLKFYEVLSMKRS